MAPLSSRDNETVFSSVRLGAEMYCPLTLYVGPSGAALRQLTYRHDQLPSAVPAPRFNSLDLSSIE